MPIDATTYNKAIKWPTGHGYEGRRAAPTSIVVHSTSSATKNTAFTAEATYLYNAPLVSAHYLIGRDGATVQFLDPLAWAAWHAGNAIPAWSNQRSIGIELHHSVGDPFYPPPQLDALDSLVLELCSHFAIPVATIETHGQIALPGPYIRKHDPADWPYAGFVLWRSRLGTPPPASRPYRVVGVPIYQAENLTGALAGHLTSGETVQIDATYANGGAHLADGRGFVDLDGLDPA